MAMTEPLQGMPAPHVETAPPGLGAWAMARLLTVALAWGAAAVPAFLAGNEPAGWCLAVLSVALVARFPMAGFCVVVGGGTYLLLTAVAVLSPTTFGPTGLVDSEGWMRLCAWLTLGAAIASLVLMDVRTFTQAFRREGRPVARWDSVGLPRR